MKTKIELLAPLLVLFLAIVLEYSGLDVAMVRPFYDEATQTWPLKEHWLTSYVLHGKGKDMVVWINVAILLALISTFLMKRMRDYRKATGYLLLANLLSPAIVAIAKSSTHIYSPWDLQIFGGNQPYIRLFDSVPEGADIGHAFPGGHSSGGFAFLSLYFLLGFYGPQYKYLGLFFGLALGTLFGVTQEMRGAHFPSHDLFSMVVCWYVAMTVFYLMFKKELAARLEAPLPTEDALR